MCTKRIYTLFIEHSLAILVQCPHSIEQTKLRYFLDIYKIKINEVVIPTNISQIQSLIMYSFAQIIYTYNLYKQ